jgi:hypothetical protein
METTQNMRQKAIDYKKNIAGRFMLVEGASVKSRIAGEDFCVTRKVDGHLTVLFYESGKAVMLNSAGKEYADAPACLDAFVQAMQAAGLKSAVLAAELYMPREEVRPRYGDVVTAMADGALRDKLAFAAFDIMEIDGAAFESSHYKEVYARLKELCGNQSPLFHCVDMRTASSPDEVKQIYEEWVEGGHAEGLVVHSESGFVTKVKPRHSIDCAVVGYTTGDQGLRDFMLSVVREDGLHQMVMSGSSGLTLEQRQDLAARLSRKHVDSEYVLADSRGIAFQMVVPEIVVEISVMEFVSRGNDGKVKKNPLLSFDPQKGWVMHGITSGVSALGVVFIQERSDKKPDATGVRVSQITDLVPFEENEGVDINGLPESTLLERRVFRKVSGAKVMVHKFLIWKTNKEQSGRYPAYVFYHTDFSNSRKEVLKRDMAFSDDEQQIRDILQAEIADNVKKGWEEV